MESLPEKQRLRVRNHLNRMTHGLHAVAPITCMGPDTCPFFSACPVPERDERGQALPSSYPVGSPCVLEYEYMAQRIAEYVLHLDVHPTNPVEISIVNELALCDLLKNRALRILASGDKTGQGRDLMHVDTSITGFTDNGTELVSQTTKLHPVAEYLDRIENRRQKWIDRLMETRKAKADWAAKMGTQEEESELLLELRKIKDFMENMGSQTLELELEGEWLPMDE
jgi:hypothetical protein